GIPGRGREGPAGRSGPRDLPRAACGAFEGAHRALSGGDRAARDLLDRPRDLLPRLEPGAHAGIPGRERSGALAHRLDRAHGGGQPSRRRAGHDSCRGGAGRNDRGTFRRALAASRERLAMKGGRRDGRGLRGGHGRPTGRREHTLGVFDSGIGGLTVVRHLRRLLPSWDIVYFGDTARVPYGTKSDATVRRFAGEAARFLTQFGVTHLVVACNTVSAVALRSLERDFRGLPVDGVIQPGAESAVKATRSGRIGVIGTRATIQSRAYEHEIAVASRHAGKTTRVFANPCPLLVPLAEEGLAGSRAAREVLRVYLAPLRARKIDTLILGCTHYPPFKSASRSVLG